MVKQFQNQYIMLNLSTDRCIHQGGKVWLKDKFSDDDKLLYALWQSNSSVVMIVFYSQF